MTGDAGPDRPALTLAAIVVTHDRLAQLQATVTRLLAEPVDHLVVVNNACTDGTAEWLAGLGDARVQVLTLSANLGGAGGFEAGMRHVRDTISPDWCLVMDDDARPEPGTVARFRAMRPQGLGAVAAAAYQPGGVICDMNRPWVNPFWNLRAFARTLFGGGRMGFHLPDSAYQAAEPVEIDGASFVGLFMSREAIAATGLPDGRLFIYGDDVLYTLSIRRAGFRIVFAPDLMFEHDFKTFSGTVQRFQPMWKAYYHHRNLLLVYRSAAGLLFWPAMVLILPKWLSKVRHYGPDRALYLRLLKLAMADALLGRLSRSHAEIVTRSR